MFTPTGYRKPLERSSLPERIQAARIEQHQSEIVELLRRAQVLCQHLIVANIPGSAQLESDIDAVRKRVLRTMD